MTVSFLAVLPAIMPDLTRRCIASMAPELRDRLLLIDNTTTGEIAAEHAGDVMFCVTEGKNTGVTHAWNDGLTMADAQDVDWVYLISASVEFGAFGGLDLLDYCVGEPYLVHSQWGWHALALHRRMWERVGRFDSQFPAYGNESDYLRRCDLAGLPSPEYNDGRFSQVNINAACEPPAACLRAGVVKVDYSEHLRRYRDKHGGEKLMERFTHPYGDDSLDWTFVGEYQGVDA